MVTIPCIEYLGYEYGRLLRVPTPWYMLLVVYFVYDSVCCQQQANLYPGTLLRMGCRDFTWWSTQEILVGCSLQWIVHGCTTWQWVDKGWLPLWHYPWTKFYQPVSRVRTLGFWHANRLWGSTLWAKFCSLASSQMPASKKILATFVERFCLWDAVYGCIWSTCVGMWRFSVTPWMLAICKLVTSCRSLKHLKCDRSIATFCILMSPCPLRWRPWK